MLTPSKTPIACPRLRRIASRLLAPLLLSGLTSAAAQTAIPSTFVQPSTAADSSKPGFIWRVHQVSYSLPNNNSRTENQLAGLLGDNIANPAAQGVALATANPPSPSAAPLLFEIGGVINLSVNGAEGAGNFVPDDSLPGIPGIAGGYENVAGELLTWLNLPAGIITLGVNSDDGFRMTIGGATPIDKFAPVAGEFDGGRPAADTLFQITVPQAGLYAARCTWEQGCCGANIEIFTVKPDGTRVLVNDTAHGGVPAYRAVTSPPKAYARKVSPAPNSTSARRLAPILVELVDGASPIDPATTALSLDGVTVPVTRSKAAGVTTVTYTPTTFYAAGVSHVVVFKYKENGVLMQPNWKFTAQDYVGPNGHFYEVVLAENGITWPDAKAAAESQGLCSARAHLATITSYEEDLYLERLRQSALPDRSEGQLWVGGYQQKDSPNYWEPGGGWVWLNNEGPIEYYNWGGTYANWYPGQPDNAWTEEGGSEDYLAIGLYNSFGWNDDGYYSDGRRDGTLGGYIVEYEPIALTVDIKPDNAQNVVSLKSNGKLPVAILSTKDFNATQIDIASIRFGRTGTEVAPANWTKQDVNKDGRMDLILQFVVQDTGLLCDDTEARLTARTTSGCPAQGRDPIEVIDCPHYSLTTTAMQDVNLLTDMDLKVQPLLNGNTTPAIASEIQLKSFDALGQLRWTKNLQNVALQQLAPNLSLGHLQFNDALPHQPVKVKMQVPDSTGKNTEILYAQAVVLLRPDLAVENLHVPPGAEPCQVVNIMATVRELNGDLGAFTTVYLYDGDQWVDTAWYVWIPPRGSADVVFSHVFGQSGTRAFKVVAGDVTPGDYNPTNNTATGSIEIGPRPFSPVSFYANYDRQLYEHQEEYQDPYYTSLYHENVTNESLYAGFSLTPNLPFPFQMVAIQLSADGVVRENYQLSPLDADYLYSNGGDYYDAAVYRQLGDGITLYLRSYSYGGCSDAVYAELYRSAANTVYHSEWHDYYWDTTGSYDGANKYGTFLNAASSLEIQFVLAHAAGVFGGGTGPIPIYQYPIDSQWDYEWPDYGFQRGYYRGEAFSGYSSGTLTP